MFTQTLLYDDTNGTTIDTETYSNETQNNIDVDVDAIKTYSNDPFKKVFISVRIWIQTDVKSNFSW